MNTAWGPAHVRGWLSPTGETDLETEVERVPVGVPGVVGASCCTDSGDVHFTNGGSSITRRWAPPLEANSAISVRHSSSSIKVPSESS